MIATLREIMESEDGEALDLVSIKIKCFYFAVKVTEKAIYTPEEVLTEAKKIFDWVTE